MTTPKHMKLKVQWEGFYFKKRSTIPMYPIWKVQFTCKPVPKDIWGYGTISDMKQNCEKIKKYTKLFG